MPALGPEDMYSSLLLDETWTSLMYITFHQVTCLGDVAWVRVCEHACVCVSACTCMWGGVLPDQSSNELLYTLKGPLTPLSAL